MLPSSKLLPEHTDLGYLTGSLQCSRTKCPHVPVQFERSLSEWIWKVPRQPLVQAEHNLGTTERAGLAKFGENI